MPYVTSIERLAKVQAIREILFESVTTRFKSVPEDVAAAVNSIRAADMLKSLIQQVIVCNSLDDFKKTLLTVQTGQPQA